MFKTSKQRNGEEEEEEEEEGFQTEKSKNKAKNTMNRNEYAIYIS